MANRNWILLLGLLLGSLAPGQDANFQDTSFQVKRMKEWNESAREGKCVLRVMVDDEVDVELQQDTVLIRRITGQSGRDDGSECTQPLPQSFFTRFAFRGIDGRGEVRLTQEPRPGNAFTAIVTIRDTRRGQEGYTFELTWTTDGQPYQGSVGGSSRTSGGYFGSESSSSTSGSTSSTTSSSTSRSSGGGGILPSLTGRIGTGNSTTGVASPQPTPVQSAPNQPTSSQPTSSQPASQPTFSGLNETTAGAGTLRLGSRTDALRRARLVLAPGGELEIQIYGAEVYTLRGRWSGQPGSLALELREGFAGGLAEGRGNLILGADGKFSTLEAQGKLSNSQDLFEIRFQR